MTSSLVIGTRGSKLALAQAELMSAELCRLNPGIALRIEIIRTTGDVKTEPLSVIGGQGVFTKELEEALFDRRIDIAVHSLKDLPTVIPDGLRLSAICARENAQDALVLSRRLNQPNPSIRTLPQKAVVGTSSQRRTAQLRYLRPDLEIRDVRGNIDTRLNKLDEGKYDALILAAAGLRRLEIANRISCLISTEDMLPAVAQGAIGLETRNDDHLAIDVVSRADDVAARTACTAERALLQALGGGCQLPIAGHAVVSGQQLRIEGLVADTAGSRIVRDYLTGACDRAGEVGEALGKRLLERGAQLLNATDKAG
jgi:hydroxymethylbilane synthase